MEKLMMIFGAVIVVEGALVYTLQKLFKSLDDKELDVFVKAMQEAHCKRLW